MTAVAQHTTKITFKRQWFNPLYFILNDIIKDPTVRTILVYGGKSSAKTMSICQILAKEAVVNCKSTIAFRKESANIKTTLKESFTKAIKTTRLHNGFTPLEFSYPCYNGSKIVMKGLDDPEKAKGIESFTHAYLNELNQFSYKEFKDINMSLRGIPGQKIIADWNPVDEKSWIKVEYLDKKEFVDTDYTLPCKDSFVKKSVDGRIVLIKTTYLDNYWICGSPCGTYGFRDENLIAEYEEMKTTDPESHQVNVLGEWGVIKPGRPFFHNLKNSMFKDESFELIINSYLILQFDFNKNPCTLSVSLINYRDKEFSWIDAFAGNEKTLHDLSPLEAICTLFKMKYIDTGLVHPAFLTITGDASGKAGSADRKASDNFYSTIRKILGTTKGQQRLRGANQPHPVSRQKCNAMLRDIRCVFYRNAKLVFNDLQLAYVDDKNTMNEAKKELGLHFGDGFRYGADCMLNFDEWEKTISYFKHNFK